jgi:predicted PurR-regulated permease PerM
MAGVGNAWGAFRGWLAHRRAEAQSAEVPDPVVHVPEPAPTAVPPHATPHVPPQVMPAAARSDLPPYPARPAHPAEAVPWTLRVAAEGMWRLLLVGAGLYVLLQIVGTLRIVALAFVAALLISALLQPTVSWLRRHGVPRGLATALTFLGGLASIALVAWFVFWQVSTHLNQLTDQVQQGIGQIRHWLETGPMHLTDTQINQFANQLTKVVGTNSDQIASFGFDTVSVVVEIVTGVFLAAFCTYFLLYDGERIWGWCLRLLPVRSRVSAAGAGPRAWATLTAYVRGTVVVAFIDSLSIGIGIYLLGVPLAMPIAVIIFLGAFIPLIGALVTGTIAVLIGLVTHGPVTALLVLAVLLGVQQIEGHLLQPLILGRAVRVHPLAVILAVASGSIIGGIGGAVVAVPLVAVTNTVVGYLRARHAVDEDVRAALTAAASE